MMALAQLGLDTSPSGARGLRTVYLYPGQMLTSRVPILVTTILGSCISVCLWDEVAAVGGINHYLLPKNPLPGQSDLRYGNTAIDRLLEEMLSAGASLNGIVAKIVGGSSVLTGFSALRGSIGDQNVAVARQELARHRIQVNAEQVGGTRGRKLHFNISDGSASSREI